MQQYTNRDPVCPGETGPRLGRDWAETGPRLGRDWAGGSAHTREGLRVGLPADHRLGPFPPRGPPWAKLAAIRYLLRRHAHLAYIDSDVFVTEVWQPLPPLLEASDRSVVQTAQGGERRSSVEYSTGVAAEAPALAIALPSLAVAP